MMETPFHRGDEQGDEEEGERSGPIFVREREGTEERGERKGVKADEVERPADAHLWASLLLPAKAWGGTEGVVFPLHRVDSVATGERKAAAAQALLVKEGQGEGKEEAADWVGARSVLAMGRPRPERGGEEPVPALPYPPKVSSQRMDTSLHVVAVLSAGEITRWNSNRLCTPSFPPGALPLERIPSSGLLVLSVVYPARHSCWKQCLSTGLQLVLVMSFLLPPLYSS